MMDNLLVRYTTLLERTGLNESWITIIENLTVLIIIVVLAFLADKITKGIIIRLIKNVVARTKNTYDDLLLENKVFIRLAHVAPALVVNALVIYLVGPEDPNAITLATVIKSLTKLYMIFILAMVIDALLSTLHDIYLTLPISKGRNIKGYVQLVKIMVYIIAVLIVISVLTSKSIGGLLAGLGAFAAVLILVFKDTILGLVASIQLSGNKMVNVGDWISMPSHNADGDVIDIGLNTVKVQNWDKTIATIPTYSLVSESFSNWKGMENSGGRRIKRSINIDMQSVKFVNDELLTELNKIQILKPYIQEKQKEIEEFNEKSGIDDSSIGNGRRMTNLGTFRKYLELYLNNNPNIHKDMTFLVRHLQPTEKGLPIEIYVFSNDQAWANYEAIQADIFDHILAVVPEFDLRVFQNPTGEDWKHLMN